MSQFSYYDHKTPASCLDAMRYEDFLKVLNDIIGALSGQGKKYSPYQSHDDIKQNPYSQKFKPDYHFMHEVIMGMGSKKAFDRFRITEDLQERHALAWQDNHQRIQAFIENTSFSLDSEEEINRYLDYLSHKKEMGLPFYKPTPQNQKQAQKELRDLKKRQYQLDYFAAHIDYWVSPDHIEGDAIIEKTGYIDFTLGLRPLSINLKSITAPSPA